MQLTWELCALVGDAARDMGWVPSPEAIWSLFCDEYLTDANFYQYITHEVMALSPGDWVQLSLKVRYRGQGMVLRGQGLDLPHAIINALGWDFGELTCTLRSESAVVSLRVAVFAEVSIPRRYTLFGIGLSESQTTGTILAILSAFNRALRRGVLDDSMKAASVEG